MIKKRRTFWRVFAVIIALLLLAWFVSWYIPLGPGPEIDPTPDTPPTSQIRHEGKLDFIGENGQTVASIFVEIADTEQERMAGLMGRTRIGENEGMLFLFEHEQERSFWMANTPLPLDILYVNSAGEIVSIYRRTQPYSEESLPSNSPAQFVVEVNAGFCDKFGVTEQMTIDWRRM